MTIFTDRADRETVEVGTILHALMRYHTRSRFVNGIVLDKSDRRWKLYRGIRDALHEEGAWKHRKQCLSAVFEAHRKRRGACPYATQLATPYARSIWRDTMRDISGGIHSNSNTSLAEEHTERVAKFGKGSSDDYLMKTLCRQLKVGVPDILRMPHRLSQFSRPYIKSLPEYRRLRDNGYYKKHFGANPFTKRFRETVLEKLLG